MFWAAKVFDETLVVRTAVPLGAEPVPYRLTMLGDVVAVLAIVINADRAPTPVGVNVTLTKQVAPDATELAQELVSMKSLGLVPFTAIELIVAETVPVFVTVKLCVPLVDPVV